jgi:D-arginine dehydrogenase
MIKVDVAIIGAGIAGASIAFALKDKCTFVVIEREDYPGYHTTGRSAAFYSEVYGGVHIQPLTTASKSFFLPRSHLKNRGVLYVSRNNQRHAIDRFQREFSHLLHLEKYNPLDAAALAPMLKPEWLAASLYDASCKDIDVAALHADFLRGVDVQLSSGVNELRSEKGRWIIIAGTQEYSAKIVVNAAGAWGDDVARLAGVNPVGLRPCRRTIVSFTPNNFIVNQTWPLVMDIEESFYFKPDAGQIWASPADETLNVPSDVQPDELDIAITVERIQQATSFEIKTLKKSWAGLRTFAPDKLPVYGFDPEATGFYWCVGQGGWGIQTAPAAGELCAAQILGMQLPQSLHEAGVEPARYAPARGFAGATSDNPSFKTVA